MLPTKKNRLEGDPRPEPRDPPSDGQVSMCISKEKSSRLKSNLLDCVEQEDPSPIFIGHGLGLGMDVGRYLSGLAHSRPSPDYTSTSPPV